MGKKKTGKGPEKRFRIIAGGCGGGRGPLEKTHPKRGKKLGQATINYVWKRAEKKKKTPTQITVNRQDRKNQGCAVGVSLHGNENRET